MSSAESIARSQRVTLTLCIPIVRWWGRLDVSGLEHLPSSGPVLLAGNHDSYWDPLVVGVAALGRRQIRALAKASLWKVRGVAPLLDVMGQIPIERAAGDAGALERAARELRAGACIGVFLEGTRSRGHTLRARSGLGRLAELVPEAQVACCTVEGPIDMHRFPKRPRIRVAFFTPEGEGLRDNETAAELSVRLLADIRSRAPIPGG